MQTATSVPYNISKYSFFSRCHHVTTSGILSVSNSVPLFGYLTLICLTVAMYCPALRLRCSVYQWLARNSWFLASFMCVIISPSGFLSYTNGIASKSPIHNTSLVVAFSDCAGSCQILVMVKSYLQLWWIYMTTWQPFMQRSHCAWHSSYP